ncbi:MAG: hypothetical protein ACYTA3_13515, partial [Planctomycetota bacterium]
NKGPERTEPAAGWGVSLELAGILVEFGLVSPILRYSGLLTPKTRLGGEYTPGRGARPAVCWEFGAKFGLYMTVV